MAEWEKIIKEDLAIARAFQMKLMTGAVKSPWIESSVTYLPLMEIGGDVYDIFEFGPGVMRFFIADATGHGITASLNTVKILTEYATVKEVIESPAAVISYLNRRFMQSAGREQIVFASAVADINRKSGTVTISTAGIPAQYILRGGTVTAIESMNRIIGLSGREDFREEKHPFEPGDTLFLTTDGLMEMEDARNGVPGADILAGRVVNTYAGRSIEEGGKELLKLFSGKKRTTTDDITFIAARRML